MYEYEVMNLWTGEIELAFGYTKEMALRDKGLNPDDWRIIHKTYID